MNVVCVGAHPDDCECYAGGTAVRWARLGHRVVFVSMTNGDAGQPFRVRVTSALLSDAKFYDVDAYVSAVDRLGGWFGGAKADLPREDWPVMVRFGDLNDPKSVEEVSPGAVGVRRIWVETTGDVVTTGLEKRLEWLNERTSFFDPGPSFDYYQPESALTFAQKVGVRDFNTEIGK